MICWTLRGTWLPKVHAEGMLTFSPHSKFVAIGCDETDDPRPSNDYIVTVEVNLILKIQGPDADTQVQSYHLQLEVPSLSIVHVQVLRAFYIQPLDVHYFIHDSAPYMGPTAERMRTIFGYLNMIDVPCWAHLLNKVGEVVFDGQLLPELSEYLRLTRLVFARSPFWRKRWVEHQQDMLKQENEKCLLCNVGQILTWKSACHCS